MISLDGSISLIKDDKVCWTINSGKQLFGLEACDITGKLPSIYLNSKNCTND